MGNTNGVPRAGKDIPKPHPLRAALPNRETQLLESPLVWTRDKARVDSQLLGVPKDLWCCQGKLYDLTDFVARHPGGPAWLELTRGTDVTDAFVVHHLNQAKCEAILKKYYVRDAPPVELDFVGVEPQVAVKKRRADDGDVHSLVRAYSFDPDGFYMTLKRRALAALGSNPKGWRATRAMHAVSWFTLACWAGLFALMCQTGSYWFALAAAVPLHGLLGVGHNFFHQPDCMWRYAFDLSLFSHHHWRITHALSHHMFINLERDTEISSLEPFIYFLSCKPRNPVFVNVAFHLILLLASTLDFSRRSVAVLLGKEEFRPEYLLAVAEAACLYWFQGWRGIGLFFCMQMVTSWMMASISFAVHRSEHSYTEGDHSGYKRAVHDFGEHVVVTSDDHSLDVSMLVSTWCYALLNRHVLHHCFPTVDNSRFDVLEPILEQTCREFNVDRRVHRDFLPLWLSVLRRHDMLVPPVQDTLIRE